MRRLTMVGTIFSICTAAVLLTSCSDVPQSSVFATGTAPVESPSVSVSPEPSVEETGLLDTSVITYTYLISGNVPPDKIRSVKLTVGKDFSTLVKTEKGVVTFQETIVTGSAVWNSILSQFPAIRTLASGAMCADSPGKAVEVSGNTGSLFAVGYQKCNDEWSDESVSLDTWIQPALDQFS